jgi:hypothetical protein
MIGNAHLRKSALNAIFKNMSRTHEPESRAIVAVGSLVRDALQSNLASVQFDNGLGDGLPETRYSGSLALRQMLSLSLSRLCCSGSVTW